MKREIFTEEHELFRDNVRRFIADEITPYHEEWEKQGKVTREIWLKAGEFGLLCVDVAEEYGGLNADYLYSVVITEELSRAGVTGPGFAVHSEMATPYIETFGTEEQKKKWLPKLVSGECIAALGLTEPVAGSDLKAMRTKAIKDGDDYIINGQKVYISNGQLSDIVILACKTDPAAGAKGMSFIIVETDREGFERGRNLEKIGLKAQDTSELFFNDLRVPQSNLLGKEGDGFGMVRFKLAQERLAIAVSAIAVVESILEWTVEYTKDRKAFGTRICDFQNTRFKMAEISAQAMAMRVFVDQCIKWYMADNLTEVTAAKVKMLCSELQCKAVDECLQFFGGYGYMLEYPIARAYIDARVRRIAGGSSEIMRELIGRDLFAD